MSKVSSRCSERNANGQPCRAWAIRESNPPLCSTHAKRNAGAGAPRGNNNRQKHGFYGRVYTLEEIADLVAYAADGSVVDELAATRVAIRRVLEKLTDKGPDEELELEDYARLAALVFTGANTVARLLKAQRVLSGEAADSLAGAMGTVLSELGQELGIDL